MTVGDDITSTEVEVEVSYVCAPIGRGQGCERSMMQPLDNGSGWNRRFEIVYAADGWYGVKEGLWQSGWLSREAFTIGRWLWCGPCIAGSHKIKHHRATATSATKTPPHNRS